MWFAYKVIVRGYSPRPTPAYPFLTVIDRYRNRGSIIANNDQ